jgi:undecaprenyl-diphosphatase
MDALQATILGIVQGLTEFLPVSSSGHLALATYHLGWGDGLPLWVGVATNTGTLVAVLVYLRRDVATAASGFLRGLVSAEARREEGWRLALLVLVGSIPTVVIGLALRPVFEQLGQALPVAIALAVTGLVLWTAPMGGSKDGPPASRSAMRCSPASRRAWRWSRASRAPARPSRCCCGAAPRPTWRRASRS